MKPIKIYSHKVFNNDSHMQVLDILLREFLVVNYVDFDRMERTKVTFCLTLDGDMRNTLDRRRKWWSWPPFKKQ